MITEEKRACFVDEWIEVKLASNKKYYESLGYVSKNGKFKIHPWDLSKGSNFKVNIKCLKCGETRIVFYHAFYNAKSIFCKKCLIKNLGESGKKDLVKQKFGKLTVIKDTEKRDKKGLVIWLCKCDCGNFCEVRSDNLKTGNSKSCGCLKKEKLKENLLSFHRDRKHFVKVDHTEEEIAQYLKSRGRELDFKWLNLSKKLRKSAKCSICGTKENLVVHHMNNYKDYPEQRYDEENLIVLCRSCHSKYHVNAIDITKKNFEVWILNNYKTKV